MEESPSLQRSVGLTFQQEILASSVLAVGILSPYRDVAFQARPERALSASLPPSYANRGDIIPSQALNHAGHRSITANNACIGFALP